LLQKIVIRLNLDAFTIEQKAETVDLFKVGPGRQLTKISKLFHSPLSKKENFQNFSRSWNFFFSPISMTFQDFPNPARTLLERTELLKYPSVKLNDIKTLLL